MSADGLSQQSGPLLRILGKKISECQIMSELGSKTRTYWGPDVRFRRVQTIGPRPRRTTPHHAMLMTAQYFAPAIKPGVVGQLDATLD